MNDEVRKMMNSVPVLSFDGGGYDGRMEARIAKLEEFAADAKQRLVKIDSRLENVSDKNDIKALTTTLSADIKALTAILSSDVKAASASLAAKIKTHRADVTSDLKVAAAATQSAIDQKASELRVESQKSTTEITRWILATVVSLFLGFAGLFFAMNNAAKTATSALAASQQSSSAGSHQTPSAAAAAAPRAASKP